MQLELLMRPQLAVWYCEKSILNLMELFKVDFIKVDNQNILSLWITCGVQFSYFLLHMTLTPTQDPCE